MAQVGVRVRVLPEHRGDRLRRLPPPQLAERDRGVEADPRARILQRLDQAVVGVRHAAVAEHPRGLRPHLVVRVLQQRKQRTARVELAQAPDRVQPLQPVRRLLRRLAQDLGGALTAHQLLLRREPHPLIAVPHQRRELGGRLLRHPLGDALGRLLRGVAVGRRIRHPEHAPLPRPLPALDPVGHVERAVGPELAVGRHRVPEELLVRDDLEARAAVLHADGADAAREVAEEELAGPAVGEAGAGVDGEARRPRAHEAGGGKDVGGGLPDLLGHPGAPAGEAGRRIAGRGRGPGLGRELEPGAPAEVGPLDHVQEAGGVAHVHVVLAGDEVAGGVERQLLRVAQAKREDLEVRAVEVAAEHGAHVGILEPLALVRHDVEAAVAHREVQLAVGPEGQPVQVVTDELEADAEPREDGLALLGDAVAVPVRQLPEVRHAGEPDLALPREDAGGEAVDHRLEAVGEHGRAVGAPVAVAVLEQPDGLGLDLEAAGVGAEPAADEGLVVGDAAGGRVLVEAAHVVADVEHAAAVPARLGHEDAAALVDREADRVLELRLGGPEADLEALGGAELADGELGVGGRRLGKRQEDRREHAYSTGGTSRS